MADEKIRVMGMNVNLLNSFDVWWNEPLKSIYDEFDAQTNITKKDYQQLNKKLTETRLKWIINLFGRSKLAATISDKTKSLKSFDKFNEFDDSLKIDFFNNKMAKKHFLVWIRKSLWNHYSQKYTDKQPRASSANLRNKSKRKGMSRHLLSLTNPP